MSRPHPGHRKGDYILRTVHEGFILGEGDLHRPVVSAVVVPVPLGLSEPLCTESIERETQEPRRKLCLARTVTSEKYLSPLCTD